MAGLTNSRSRFFKKMVKALEDRDPLVALWPTLPEPMKSRLGFRLAVHGALEPGQLGAETLELIASLEAEGTNWSLEDFDAVWPGAVGGKALAKAAGEPGCSIWSEKVVGRLLPHASPEELARVVLNLDYGPTVLAVAEKLDPVPEGLATALVQADRSQPQRFGLHMAAIVLAKAGLADTDLFVESLSKPCNAKFAPLYARAWQVFGPEFIERHIAPCFKADKRGYGDGAIWSWLPELPLPLTLERACDAIRSWPRGDPYLRSRALEAFKKLPRAAAPTLSEQDIAKFPQRDIVAWGLASAGGELAWPKLAELLADSHSGVREAAVHGLSDPGAIEVIDRALASRKKGSRLGAARALAAIPVTARGKALAERTAAKEKAAEVLAALKPLLSAEADAPLPLADEVTAGARMFEEAGWNEDGRQRAMDVLSALGPGAEAAVQVMLATMEDWGLADLWWWYGRTGWPGAIDFMKYLMVSSQGIAKSMAPKVLGELGVLAPEHLSAKKADVRIEAAKLYLAVAGPEHVEVIEAAMAKEKSKKVREVLAGVLEACLAAGERPLSELGLDDLAELESRFARRVAEAPVSLEGLSLSLSDGTPVSPRALRGLISALADREDLSSLRPLFDPDSASALRAGLGERTAGTKEHRYGWVVQLTGVFAQESELADYGRSLDDKARSGDHLEAFAKVEALARHGSSAALQWVDHWARRARSNGLRERAGLALDEAAKKLGLSRDELAERVLSDFGLDARGQRDFVYAERTYTLRLANDLSLSIFLDGAKRRALPKAKTEDDKARRKELSALKKQLKTGVKAAIERLESAMIDGRSWSVEAWREVFTNPVNRRLAEQLLWWDGTRAFRVAEDGSFADLEDETVEIDAEIRLAHPLRMTDTEAWAQVLADYEMLPPFPQLDRPALAPVDGTVRSLDNWIAKDVGTGRLRGFMARKRWIRGTPQDGGVVLWMVKPFRNSDVTAVLDFQPGLGMGYDFEQQQEIRELTFVRGVHSDKPGYRLEGIPLSEIDPVVYAEVVASIEALYDTD